MRVKSPNKLHLNSCAQRVRLATGFVYVIAFLAIIAHGQASLSNAQQAR